MSFENALDIIQFVVNIIDILTSPHHKYVEKRGGGDLILLLLHGSGKEQYLQGIY